jgi:allantoinase
MLSTWTIRSRRVVLPDGAQPAAIRVRNGRIHAICSYATPCDEDMGDLVIMPGLVDTHVHINDPGRTCWEGFDTATRAAAAGGITTLVDMPLNSIPATTSVSALHQKIAAAEENCWVDVGFWGGIVPGNHSDVEPLLDAGCMGFKCFLAPSGVDEFPCVSETDLRRVAPYLCHAGSVLLVHAELPEFLDTQVGTTRSYKEYAQSRPASAETMAIKLLATLSRETGLRVHIVHLSSFAGVRLLSALHRESLPITAETCPHYLTFAAEEIPDGATEFKCAPPIRQAKDRDALWYGLRTREIGMVVSDHSPCPAELKCKEEGDFSMAWGGIASLQLGLQIVWTEARKRGFTVADIARSMAEFPAQLAGLNHRKGKIAPGYDADFVIWNPEEQFVVHPELLHHRHKLTPYLGMCLSGTVKKTYLRGKPVCFDDQPGGIILKRLPEPQHAATTFSGPHAHAGGVAV